MRDTGPPLSASLARRLDRIAASDGEYWSFVNRDQREHVHSLLHYPAMMVPRLQRELLAACLEWDPSIGLIMDPFVGSGTVLTEAMLAGRDFVGLDVNPLAILACRVKAENVSVAGLARACKDVLCAVASDASSATDLKLDHLGKWFEPHVRVGLSKLRRAILAITNARSRRFFWIVLAETIRLSSNSRTSTAKLHLRPPLEISTRPDPVTVFADVARRNLRSVALQADLLRERNLLTRGRYRGRCDLRIADARTALVDGVGLVMSSPPYGDNHTTIAYGQASYLPLQWIPSEDISSHHSPATAKPIRALDTASLGGSWKGALVGVQGLLDRSPHLRRTWDLLADQPRDRRVRVAAYFRDLDASLDAVLACVRPGALMLWTVADRSVGGTRMPLTLAIPELLGGRAATVTSIQRTIPAVRKSMPTHNSVSETIKTETVLVMRTPVAATRPTSS